MLPIDAAALSVKYHSVWVEVPASLMDPLAVHRMDNDTPDGLEYAAALGYDGVAYSSTTRTPTASCPRPTS